MQSITWVWPIHFVKVFVCFTRYTSHCCRMLIPWSRGRGEATCWQGLKPAFPSLWPAPNRPISHWGLFWQAQSTFKILLKPLFQAVQTIWWALGWDKNLFAILTLILLDHNLSLTWFYLLTFFPTVPHSIFHSALMGAFWLQTRYSYHRELSIILPAFAHSSEFIYREFTALFPPFFLMCSWKKADLTSSPSPVWEQPGSESSPPLVLWHVLYQCVLIASQTRGLRTWLNCFLGRSLHLGFRCAPGSGPLVFPLTKKLKKQNYLPQCPKSLLMGKQS